MANMFPFSFLSFIVKMKITVDSKIDENRRKQRI